MGAIVGFMMNLVHIQKFSRMSLTLEGTLSFAGEQDTFLVCLKVFVDI